MAPSFIRAYSSSEVLKMLFRGMESRFVSQEILGHHFVELPRLPMKYGLHRVHRHSVGRLERGKRRHDELHWFYFHVEQCRSGLPEPGLHAFLQIAGLRDRSAPEPH